MFLGVAKIKVQGKLNTLKKSHIQKIEKLYRRKIPKNQIITVELAEALAEISFEINKEIALIVNRKGQIIEITVGDAEKIELPQLKNIREARTRLCGLRCIHTHPNGLADLSKADLTALEKYRFDAMAAIGIDKNGSFSRKFGITSKYADSIQIAFLSSDAVKKWDINETITLYDAEKLEFDFKIEQIESDLANKYNTKDIEDNEKALLISLYTKDKSDFKIIESMAELEELAFTAGAEVVEKIVQKRPVPDAACYIGTGKAYEAAVIAREKNANIVIIDAELSPRQQKTLEQIIGVKTIDRTELILDIFAQRAMTKEGKLQVELAQLKYLFPRLIGEGISLSRQGGVGGGIATRGPGETKLEIDRRRIRDRINFLEKEVEKIKAQRIYQRRQREQNLISTAAIVGYTNVGKSTLLNALANSSVLAENKLFATLDPVTRKININGELSVLLTDTVGFIQNLPTDLIAAFRATLEETINADVIIHVVDASHPACLEHVDTVYEILSDLEAMDKPFITLLNKIDLVDKNDKLNELAEKVPNPILISAKNRKGFEKFTEKLKDVFSSIPV